MKLMCKRKLESSKYTASKTGGGPFAWFLSVFEIVLGPRVCFDDLGGLKSLSSILGNTGLDGSKTTSNTNLCTSGTACLSFVLVLGPVSRCRTDQDPRPRAFTPSSHRGVSSRFRALTPRIRVRVSHAVGKKRKGMSSNAENMRVDHVSFHFL